MNILTMMIFLFFRKEVGKMIGWRGNHSTRWGIWEINLIKEEAELFNLITQGSMLNHILGRRIKLLQCCSKIRRNCRSSWIRKEQLLLQLKNGCKWSKIHTNSNWKKLTRNMLKVKAKGKRQSFSTTIYLPVLKPVNSKINTLWDRSKEISTNKRWSLIKK